MPDYVSVALTSEYPAVVADAVSYTGTPETAPLTYTVHVTEVDAVVETAADADPDVTVVIS